MDKRSLTERDICTKFILPAVKRAGWDEMVQVREEVFFTKGRIIVRGKLVTRGKAKKADFVLYYKPNIPIALIEAKDNTHSVGDGMQQALDYAETLKIPFVFSSNGDGFVFHGGDWPAYEAELHRIFVAEIANGGVQYEGLRVGCRRHPEAARRWASFWHLVQEGRVEDDRLPDLRRCERIRWVRWVIENAAAHAEIDVWQNTRGTEVNTLLWFREEYLVVLGQRQGYWLLRTAYCTDRNGRIAQLRRERDALCRANP